jgi:hypothetical protein
MLCYRLTETWPPCFMTCRRVLPVNVLRCKPAGMHVVHRSMGSGLPSHAL